MSVPPLDSTFGALLLGSLVSVILYGVSVVQYLHYYTYHRADIWFLRLLVAVTFVFDTVGLILFVHTVYWHIVSNFLNPPSLLHLDWSIKLAVLFNVFTATAVQCIYTVRVLRMTKSYVLTAIISVLVMVSFAWCIVWVVRCWPLTSTKDLPKMTTLTIITNSLQATVDTLIAISLCVMLHKCRTGFKETDALINKLIIFLVNTGLLTSVLAIAVVISSLASPHTQYFAACYFIIGRLYTNSLLALLNSRNIIHRQASHIHISMPADLVEKSEANTRIPTASAPAANESVHERDAKTDWNA